MQVAARRRAGRGHRTGLGARAWGRRAHRAASAVAVAAATHGDGEVLVHFPGGDLRVRLAEGRAWLTGPAEPLDSVDQVAISNSRRTSFSASGRGDSSRQPTISGVGKPYVPAGKLALPHAGHDDGARRHDAAMLDRLRRRSRR